jgi:hypothetical protein
MQDRSLVRPTDQDRVFNNTPCLRRRRNTARRPARTPTGRLLARRHTAPRAADNMCRLPARAKQSIANMSRSGSAARLLSKDK